MCQGKIDADTVTAAHAIIVRDSALLIPNFNESEAAEWVIDEGKHAPLHTRQLVADAWNARHAGNYSIRDRRADGVHEIACAAPAEPPRLNLAWGSWEIPAGAPVAWGARAIYTENRGAYDANHTKTGAERKRRVMDYFSIELLGDRQATARSEAATERDAKALVRWVNKTALPELRKLCSDRYITPESATTVEISSDGYALKAGPKASYGYLYIVAWKLPPEPTIVTEHDGHLRCDCDRCRTADPSRGAQSVRHPRPTPLRRGGSL